MATKFYNDYINSTAWKVKRQEALKHYGHRCMVCESKNELHVHHTSYTNLGNEPINELLVLCKECHRLVHLQYTIASKSFSRINMAILHRQAVKDGGYIKAPLSGSIPRQETKKHRRRRLLKQNPAAWQAALAQTRILKRLEKKRQRDVEMERRRLQKDKVYNPILGTWSSKLT